MTRLRALVCALAVMGASGAALDAAATEQGDKPQAGIQGEFSEGFWSRPFDPEGFRSTKLSVALAMVIPNVRAYRIDAEPSLLSREVTLMPATTRRGALDELGKDSGLSISKVGRVLTVLGAEPRQKPPAPTPPSNATQTVPGGSSLKTVDLTRGPVNSPATIPAPLVASFRATLADDNIRLTLVRWARIAGWTFAPEHWNASVDITLSAEADFGQDFKSATRSLLATTELASSPLQPCFYSNNVLRVIPMVERCDRTRTN